MTIQYSGDDQLIKKIFAILNGGSNDACSVHRKRMQLDSLFKEEKDQERFENAVKAYEEQHIKEWGFFNFETKTFLPWKF